MSDMVKCTLCGWTQAVSAEDPDTVVEEVVSHAAKTHGFDSRLGLPKTVELVLGSESHDSETPARHTTLGGHTKGEGE